MHSNKFAVYIFGLFSSSLDVLVKLYKTTSSQKQFPSDCITLYHDYTYCRTKMGEELQCHVV